jgi:DNA-binding transcriptional regulator YhcF (GntR family)
VRHVLVIDPDGALPPYEQVRNQLAERIDTGELAPGERLPTVRGLATELGLAANTVARAYRELEQAGIVATRGRKGTFVVDAADQPWRRDAEAAAEAYAARLRELGVPTGVGIELATRAIEEPPG